MSDIVRSQAQSTKLNNFLVRNVLNNFFSLFSVVSAHDNNYYTYAGIASVMGFVHCNIKNKDDSNTTNLNAKNF